MEQIPLAYRLMFHYFEPTMTALGAIQALVAPSSLIRTTLRSIHADPAITSSALAPLMTHTAGSWALLVFHDAVTLRVLAADPRVWRLVLGASFLSDVGYTTGLVQSMGVADFFDATAWDVERALVIISTVAPMLFKVCFVLGVGMRESGTSRLLRKRE